MHFSVCLGAMDKERGNDNFWSQGAHSLALASP